MRIITYDSTHCQVWWSARPIIVNRSYFVYAEKCLLRWEWKRFWAFGLYLLFWEYGSRDKKMWGADYFWSNKNEFGKAKKNRKNKTFQFVSLSRYRVQKSLEFEST